MRRTASIAAYHYRITRPALPFAGGAAQLRATRAEAFGIGFVVFGDLPEATAAAGSGIIVASGLYVLYREAGAGRGENRASRPVTGRNP